MDKLNTYFVPLSISMLPEYIASGFIGLTSSKEPEFDIQSLGYPNVSVVSSINEATLDVCIEIKTPEIAIESKKKNYKYITGHVKSGISKKFSNDTEIVKIFPKWYNSKSPFEYLS